MQFVGLWKINLSIPSSKPTCLLHKTVERRGESALDNHQPTFHILRPEPQTEGEKERRRERQKERETQKERER